MKKLIFIPFILLVMFAVFTSVGCSDTQAKQPAPQPLTVRTETIDLTPVPRLDEYVATVKSRRSASIQPQVDGSLTRILVKSGDHVRAGQVLMTIDPLKQQATVDQQRSTEAQKRATYDYNRSEVERQRQLYEGGVTSKQNYELAVQAFENSKADWEASTAGRITQQRQLAYYNLTAPFSGVVGDVPVHIGDYVSPQTLLTTVDENAELEAYIYIPTERASDIRMGLAVEVVTSAGELIESTKINFRFAASGQRDPGHPGESADPQVAGRVSQFPARQGAGSVEHGPHADGSCAGGHAHRRTGICLRCDAGGERRYRQAACSNPWRYDREQLRRHRWLEAGGKSHHLRNPVPHRRRAYTSNQLTKATVEANSAAEQPCG